MRRGSRTLALICLVGILVSLLLAGVALAIREDLLSSAVAASYTPLTGEAEWVGGWELSESGADPSEAGSQNGTDRAIIPFTGTDLALTVRRGDYRGYLYVSVDGEPASRLPRDRRGAYLVLTSPDYEPQIATIPVAGGLRDGSHVAVVVAERGWDQWPLAGWTVSRTPDTFLLTWALTGLGGLAVTCLLGAMWFGARAARAQTGGGIAAKDLGPKLPDALATGLVLVVALVFYFSPWLSLALVSGLTLAVLIILRLDVGLALVAAVAPFYLHPRPLLGKAFSMGEIATLLCLLSWGIRLAVARRRGKTRLRYSVSSLDLAALGFVVIAFLSFFAAQYRHVALRELRVLVLEPALFYLMLRATRLDGRAVWRIVDLFVAGAVAVALLGLVQYAFCDVDLVRQALGDVIRAEGGFHRLRSVYGSPNSVGLYLGRALPLLVAVVLFGGSRHRRVVYGLVIVPVGLAVLLSFSRGAFALGVPLSLLAVGVLAGGRWLWASLGAVGAGAIAAIPLLRTPRFASLLDTRHGTLFLRLHLWRASWRMFCEHPWLGVGPDNFLYLYRSRYILPAAWEEPDLSQAHTILLDYATRMGIPGLAVGLWLQAAFWQAALSLRRLADPDRRALALGLMGSMVNFLAHGLVDASYFLIDLAFVFFMTLAMVQWLRSTRRENDGIKDQP